MHNEICRKPTIFMAEGTCEQIVDLVLAKTCVKDAAIAVHGSNLGQRVGGGIGFVISDAVVTVEQVRCIEDISTEVASEPVIYS
jgi:hypothetical protein